MQKPWQRCVGQQPYWLCLGRKSSHGTQSYIRCELVSRIDFGGQLRRCPGCWRQLPIPSVLYVGLVLKLSKYKRTLSSMPQFSLVTRTGWKPLPVNQYVLSTMRLVVCGMWYTATGLPYLRIWFNYEEIFQYIDSDLTVKPIISTELIGSYLPLKNGVKCLVFNYMC